MFIEERQDIFFILIFFKEFLINHLNVQFMKDKLPDIEIRSDVIKYLLF